MLTIPELKKADAFLIEETISKNLLIPDDVEVSRYIFTYEEKDKDKGLFITGDVFGKEKYRISNALEVLFQIAKGWPVKVNIDKKMQLDLRNYKVIFE